MIDVAHSVSLVDFPHDQYFPNNNTPATIATTTPVQASFGFDLTGELIQSTSYVNNFFEIPTLIAAMTFQLSDQDININQSQSNVSPSQQQNSRQYNDMAATAFSNQHQYPHDTSVQQTSILPSPPFVEPSGNYIAIPSTTNNTQTLPYGYPSSTLPTTNAQSIALTNNLETGNHIGNNYSRNTYISNSTQQQQQQQQSHQQHHHHQQQHLQQPQQQPQQSHHQSRIELSNQIIPGYFNPLNQYQNSIPSTIGNNSQHHGNHQKPISRSINNFSRQDAATTNLPISIAPNLFMQQFNSQSSNMLVPLYDPSTIFTTKPTPTPTPNPISTTISISQNSTTTTESTSPTKQTYSYSGPPKSYYSRLPLYDRPFKCDQCPQSFNRNHDLKRHKRIHLAVKPYPCQYCEKQFSRKDALKRHVLVKGCNNTSNNNKKSTSNNANNNNNKNVVESTSNTTTTTTTIENYVDNGDQIKTEPTNDSFMSSI